MKELAEIKKRTKPHNVLLVVDAMTGQDAVNVAEQFAEVADFDGVILTKLDGDARGGAALSVKAITGKPILYASTGEKLGDFERFHPDRMAQRILGMGDVMTLVEKAERADGRAPGAGARAQDPQGAVHARRLPRPDEAGAPAWGRSQNLLADDARASGKQLGQLQVEREGARPPRGDHPVDDAGGAGQPADHRRLAPAADRARIGDHRPGGVAAREAVRADEEGHEPALAGEDALAAAAGRAAVANLSRLMSVRVRLTRVGSKKNPIWRVVVADQRSPRDGRFIETIGQYNPQTEPSTIRIDEERLQHWLARGAQAEQHREAADEGAGQERRPNARVVPAPAAPAEPEAAVAEDGRLRARRRRGGRPRGGGRGRSGGTRRQRDDAPDGRAAGGRARS